MYTTNMAKKRTKRPRDPVQLAKLIGDIATGQAQDEVEDDKNPAAVTLGERGGKARALKLTKQERQTIAHKAVQVRWQKKKAESDKA